MRKPHNKIAKEVPTMEIAKSIALHLVNTIAKEYDFPIQYK